MIAILLIILLAALIYTISHYNQLQKLAKHTRLAFMELINVSQQRIDLVNQLSELVSTFAKDKPLSAKLAQPALGSLPELITTNESVTTIIEELLFNANQQPQLEANPIYRQWLDQLSETEQLITQKQAEYTHQAQLYNTYRLLFPQKHFAARLGYLQL